MDHDGFIMREKGTLVGDGGSEVVVQEAWKWKDTEDAIRLVLQIDVWTIDDCTLYIETATTRNGDDWTAAYTHAVGAGVGHFPICLEAIDGATYPLERFVRWRVESDVSPTGDWVLCFGIAAALKK